MNYTTQEKLEAAIEYLKTCPTVDIKGKAYSTVATRVECFRQYFADWSITTAPFGMEDAWVRVKCEIADPEGRVIASDMAEENRSQGAVNRTSALENCTTSAIGRALANFGLHGGEYASAGEVNHAIETQKAEKNKDKKAEAGFTKTTLKAASHDIARQIAACETLDRLRDYWESDEVIAFRKNAKTHYPEGLAAVAEMKDKTKDELSEEEERRAIQGEPLNPLAAG